MTKEIDQVIKEFNDKFKHIGNKGVVCDNITVIKLRQFIGNALEQQAEVQKKPRNGEKMTKDEIEGIIRPLFDKFTKTGVMLMSETADELSKEIAKAIAQDERNNSVLTLQNRLIEILDCFPNSIKVGTILKLKVEVLGNKIGIIGAVYEEYNIGHKGVSVIFENGEYDGFPEDEYDKWFEVVGFNKKLSGYAFKNVMKLSEDFRLGVFDVIKSRR